jgi:hypothetical protein
MTTNNVRKLITITNDMEADLHRLAAKLHVTYTAAVAMALTIGIRSISANVEPERWFDGKDLAAMAGLVGKTKAGRVTQADKDFIRANMGADGERVKGRRRSGRKG